MSVRKQKSVLTKKLILPAIAAAAVCLVLWGIFAPEHWLSRIDNLGPVTVDNRSVAAEFYMGSPTGMEARSFILAHVPGEGDFLLDIEDETYREAVGREFVFLNKGAWAFKAMQEGRFLRPLPFRNMNECRIRSSKGHLVIISM